MIVRVSVTQRDIDRGKREDCACCPLVFALRRALPRAGRVLVYNDHALVADPFGGDALRVPLPCVARWFVARFDTGERVGPFTFYLEVARASAA